MKAKLEVTLRATVMIEIPDSRREELEMLDYPMDVDDFERATGLRIDPDDMLNPVNLSNSYSCEVEDICFEKSPESGEPPCDDDGEVAPGTGQPPSTG